jgi:hypothetical protein
MVQYAIDRREEEGKGKKRGRKEEREVMATRRRRFTN